MTLSERGLADVWIGPHRDRITVLAGSHIQTEGVHPNEALLGEHLTAGALLHCT